MTELRYAEIFNMICNEPSPEYPSAPLDPRNGRAAVAMLRDVADKIEQLVEVYELENGVK